jgi:P pilus assembly chaperone PapD
MTRPRRRMSRAAATMISAAALLSIPSPASAELILSQLVVDLAGQSKQREDIEVLNSSDERTYVAVDASEIVRPGRSDELRQQEQDPEKRGLLVSPTRMVLEPGQRKLVRIAAIGSRREQERVYRVTVKPVAGNLESSVSGLKILVGYDVLVLVRPISPSLNLVATRSGNTLTIRNDGNVSVELVDGKQCNLDRQNCISLPPKRLYSGAQWKQELSSSSPVEYTAIGGGKSVRRKF